uniref:RelA/SpoT domain-containing protein n=1 Tax=Pyramimonas obovata TaxID=1411642 RepID=A0A7S0REV5_9CHLO|mmetsp:Transcript_32615/g.71255  ORF Transcript_32615/g.71255 Transcript_32615/m.71255 type:complete len:793 (+) Transcript_32615:208-2586(+)|eukprot:CAMPEP_0118922090 /NCGR_PEP_ID=MMETSP1169-20130426/1138_1 /TAXON_ID=36882 /ORGANISM="Pyramimonas obovata, Strain CCMP722" /LENGTH=792 /DNA_ID=CAMNT_0006862911 /DNA_START=194 /DNA_END=2572 /DNA_ORIENTATION=-
MSVFSTSPPLRQGFCTSAPQSSDTFRVGSSGRSSLLGHQLRSKPALPFSPVTPLGALGWSVDTEDATPFTSAVASSFNTPSKMKRTPRSFDSMCSGSVGTGVDPRTRGSARTRSKAEPVPVSVGFRVNRKSVDNYQPPTNGQIAYKNDVKPLGLLKMQLSKRRSAEDTADSSTSGSPTSPNVVTPVLTPVVAEHERMADGMPSLEECTSLGSTPRSALEANIKLADDHDSMLKAAQAQHKVFHDRVVRRAFCIARSAHTGNFRENGDPCLAKCVGTALILADYGLSAPVVAAGLLNDCLEDSMMTEDQLRHLIDDEVVDMVVGVGKLRSLHDLYSTSLDKLHEVELDRLRTMLLVMSDVNVMMIKLADQLRHLSALDHLPAEDAQILVAETHGLLVPLANRLGVWRLKSDLEDACMRFESPEEYRQLSASLAERCDAESVLGYIATVQGALKERGVGFRDITGRNKNVFGVAKKMRKKGKKLEEVFDVRAIRVVVSHETECYKVLEAVHGLWGAQKTKDYIRSPKANGYQSLHTVLMMPDGCPLEVQIRTERMDQVAEYGVAAHWRYKEGSSSGANPFHERQVEWARFVLSWHSEVNDHKLRVDPGQSVEEDGAEVCACTFPEHRPHCKHKRLETEPVPSMSSSRQDTDPVYVIVKKEGGAVDLQMLPPRATLRTLRKKLAQVQSMENVRLVVNAHEEDCEQEAETELNMGDVVDLVVEEAKPSTSPGSSPALIDISEDAIHRERVRLSQLWSASAHAPDEQPVYHYQAPKARPVRILSPAYSTPELRPELS